MKSPNSILEQYRGREDKPKKKFNFDSEKIFHILMIIISIIIICLLYFYTFNKETEQPIPNKYTLVEFTNSENNNSYTDVVTTDSNDKYIKYIFIDENNSIQIDRIKDNYRTNIKLVETTNKPFVEIETIEKKELFVFDTSETIYKLYLPKEDIEKIKNEM